MFLVLCIQMLSVQLGFRPLCDLFTSLRSSIISRTGLPSRLCTRNQKRSTALSSSELMLKISLIKELGKSRFMGMMTPTLNLIKCLSLKSCALLIDANICPASSKNFLLKMELIITLLWSILLRKMGWKNV